LLMIDPLYSLPVDGTRRRVVHKLMLEVHVARVFRMIDLRDDMPFTLKKAHEDKMRLVEANFTNANGVELKYLAPHVKIPLTDSVRASAVQESTHSRVPNLEPFITGAAPFRGG